MRIFCLIFLVIIKIGQVSAQPMSSYTVAEPTKIIRHVNNGKYARGGLPFLREDADRWVGRLKKEKLKVENVFVQLSPFYENKTWIKLLTCFNRKIQKPEYSFWWSAEYHISYDIKILTTFNNGKSVEWTGSQSNPSGDSDEITDKKLNYRCFFSALTKPEKQSKVKSIVISISRKTKYQGTYKSILKNDKPTYFLPLEYNKKRIIGERHGEAFWYSQRCKKLSVVTSINPPDENDKGEYAIGFEKGWSNGKDFLGGNNSNCEKALSHFRTERMVRPEVQNFYKIDSASISNLLERK